jgi:rare lipoprotein A
VKTSVSTLLTLILLTFILSACSSSGRYKHAKDSTPTRVPNKAELRDATPREENHSRGGNKDYTVRGKHYQVLKSAKNFKQTGVASWYGNKFHGHLTSNGEIYDMYGMSAAHKNLPLPTYLKVTNTANNKSVVVRVNDRGPFHKNRIIDLSYSAAYKLGMLKTGTAKVEITAMTDFNKNIKKTAQSKVLPQKKHNLASNASSNIPEKNYIQVFATKNAALAEKTAQVLKKQYNESVVYPIKNGIYRVQIGPINEANELSEILARLQQSGYPKAYRRKLLQ